MSNCASRDISGSPPRSFGRQSTSVFRMWQYITKTKPSGTGTPQMLATVQTRGVHVPSFPFQNANAFFLKRKVNFTRGNQNRGIKTLKELETVNKDCLWIVDSCPRGKSIMHILHMQGDNTFFFFPFSLLEPLLNSSKWYQFYSPYLPPSQGPQIYLKIFWDVRKILQTSAYPNSNSNPLFIFVKQTRNSRRN